MTKRGVCHTLGQIYANYREYSLEVVREVTTALNIICTHEQLTKTAIDFLELKNIVNHMRSPDFSTIRHSFGLCSSILRFLYKHDPGLETEERKS